MAVKIRMKKLGRKGRPFFRVCAIDIRSPRNGRVIEELGSYDPMVGETDARTILNGERIAYWMSVGATPSPKCSVLIRKYGKEGSHLGAQQQAIERLGQRRQKSIAAALAAAAAAPKTMPKPVEPEAVTEVEAAPVEATEASGEAASE